MQPQAAYTISDYVSFFRGGDERGLSYIFKKLYPLLIFYAHQYTHNRELAEEIAATAFVKAWRHHEKLETFKGIKCYLLKIVERDCRRAMVKSSNPRTILAEAGIADSAFENLVKAETIQILHTAIKQLPAGMRAVIEQLYMEGKTPTETAKILNINTSTVDTQKKRGIAALKKSLLRFGLSVCCIIFYFYFLF